MSTFHPRKLTEKLTSAFLQVNGGAQLLKILFQPWFHLRNTARKIFSFYAYFYSLEKPASARSQSREATDQVVNRGWRGVGKASCPEHVYRWESRFLRGL